MATFINMTPHTINMNDGRAYPSQGVARVSVSFSDPDANCIVHQVFGSVTGLPAPQPDTYYIVSGVVLAACVATRGDVVAPATGHPDTVRNAANQVASVPYFTC